MDKFFGLAAAALERADHHIAAWVLQQSRDPLTRAVAKIALDRVASSNQWSIPTGAIAGIDFLNAAYKFNGSTSTRSSLLAADPRTYTDPFMSANWGARTDPANTNLSPIDYTTAVLGDLGSGGAFPGNWTWINAFSLTTTILAADATGVTFRIHGTTGAGGNMRLLMSGNGDIVTAVNTLYTISFDVEVIGPTYTPNLALTKGVRYFTSAVGFISESFPAVGVQTIRNDGKGAVPVSYQATTPATGARLQPEFGILVVPPTTAVDMTFRISNNQVTLGAGKMPRGTTTVAADSLSITTLNSLMSGDCAFMAGVRLPPDSISGTIMRMGSGSNRVEIYHSNYLVKLDNVVGGVTTTTTLGYVVPWMKTRVAFAKRSNVIFASLNGKTEVNCGTGAASPTGLTLGSGANAMRGAMAEFAAWNTGIAGLAAQAALSGHLYDDFDRADGAVGSAVTGQTYMLSGTSSATARIVSKKVLMDDSGQATSSTYFTTDMVTPPWLFGGSVSWDNQAGNASQGLITTPNLQGVHPFESAPSEADAITALANHFLASPSGVFAGQFLANTLNDHQFAFASAATKDGVTLGTTVWMMRPTDGALMVRINNGELIRFADNDYRSYTGRYAVPEIYWSVASPAQPKWQVWSAET